MEQIEGLWEDWTVQSEIGHGAYGKVYKIVREEMGTCHECALKVIHIPQEDDEAEGFRAEGMSDEEIREFYKGHTQEWINEIKVMESLKGNTNIVGIEDYRIIESGAYGWNILIRMEYLTALTAYLKEHPLTEGDVIKIGSDICNALAYCEKLSIIHRDIKPANIFVSKFGDFKLGDFGIAKHMEGANSEMSLKGTMNYMAPEIFRGEKYDSTVDIYSLGIVLYRLLNLNRAPFIPHTLPLGKISYSERERLNQRRLQGDPLPNPIMASEPVIRVIQKACQYQVKKRYRSASLFGEELRKCLDVIDAKRLVFGTSEQLASSESATVLISDVSAKKRKRWKRPVLILGIAGIVAAAIAIYIIQPWANQELEESKTAIEESEPPVGETTPQMEQEDEVPADVEVAESEVVGNEDVPEEIEYFIVPNVVNRGYTKDSAIVAFVEAGFSKDNITIEESYSDTVEEGGIVRQSAPAFSRATADRQITLVVSLGAETTSVPDLYNKTIEQATTMLSDADLVMGSVKYKNSSKVKAGKVISQSVEAGEQVGRKTEINLKISLGKKVSESADDDSGNDDSQYQQPSDDYYDPGYYDPGYTESGDEWGDGWYLE